MQIGRFYKLDTGNDAKSGDTLVDLSKIEAIEDVYEVTCQYFKFRVYLTGGIIECVWNPYRLIDTTIEAETTYEEAFNKVVKIQQELVNRWQDFINLL